MIKLQLHFHTNKDPLDTFIDYSPYEAIREAKKYNYSVLSFTHHRQIVFDILWAKYAWKNNILLIPGVEYEIYGKHILVYNPTEDLYKVKTFQQLREYKYFNPQVKIVAPHPFYPGRMCLRDYLIKYEDIFDGVEWSSYYTKYFGKKPNIKALNFAKKYNKKLIANADIHNLKNINDTYSLINYKIDFNGDYYNEVNKFLDILFSINTKIFIHSNPFSLYKFVGYNLFFIKGWLRRFYIKKFNINGK